MKKKIKESLLVKIRIKGSDKTIDAWHVIFEDDSYEYYTDDLLYGAHLPIVFDSHTACFVIKDYAKLKKKWYLKHGRKKRDLNGTLERFAED